MEVVTALNGVIKVFTFPADSDLYFRTNQGGFIQVSPQGGKSHWFNPDYVISINPIRLRGE